MKREDFIKVGYKAKIEKAHLKDALRSRGLEDLLEDASEKFWTIVSLSKYGAPRFFISLKENFDVENSDGAGVRIGCYYKRAIQIKGHFSHES